MLESRFHSYVVADTFLQHVVMYHTLERARKP